MTASAARSPFCHAPPTVPHKVWWTASPANQTTSFNGSDKALRFLRARRHRRKCAESPGVFGPRRGVYTQDGCLCARAKNTRNPIECEVGHRVFTLVGELDSAATG